MSLFEIQRLTRQNKKLTETVREQTRIIASFQNTCATNDEIVKKSTKEKEHYQNQIKDLKRRIQQQRYEREEMQNRKLEDEIDDRKKKYQKLESKIEPLLDHDTVRLKILNQVEGVHFIQLNEEKRKVNSLKDQILKYKREIQVLKHKLQTEKMDHQEELRKIKMWAQENRNKDHFNNMTYEVCIELENKLRLNYEEARKESQYYKDKYFKGEKRNQQKMANLEKQLQILKEKQLIVGK